VGSNEFVFGDLLQKNNLGKSFVRRVWEI